MKKNDFVLPILIILLAFFLPASIYGVHRHNQKILDKDNPEHLAKKDGKLYFYDNDNLLGVYECENEGLCNRASTSIEDADNLFYEGENHEIPIYNNDYVFIQDSGQIYYYSIKKNEKLLTLNSVKDYGIGISGGLLILQDEYLKYGLFDPTSGSYLIQSIYDYMAFTGQYLNEDKISTEKIIVKKENDYYLIDETENILTAKMADSIYAFDDKNIYIKSNLGNYGVFDYQGNKIIPEEFKAMTFLENSNVLITTDNMVRIYSKDYISLYYDERYESIDLIFEANDEKVIIKDKDSNIIATVELKEDIREVPDDEQSPEEEDEE